MACLIPDVLKEAFSGLTDKLPANVMTSAALEDTLEALSPEDIEGVSHYYQMPITPLAATLATTSWYAQTWEEIGLTEEDIARWRACLEDLKNLVRASFTDGAVDVHEFGSMASGFATAQSDLD
eukprot:4787914-Amphidinium_carterae.1